VSAARDLVKGGDKFGGGIKGGIFEERVGKKIETASFHIGGGSDRRSSRNKDINGVGGTP
jgi:hypothetical protein